MARSAQYIPRQTLGLDFFTLLRYHTGALDQRADAVAGAAVQPLAGGV